MNNIHKIFLFQYLPAFGKRQLQNIRTIFFRKDCRELFIIENIDYFQNEIPKTKRALISLSPEAWIVAIQEYPEIKSFNTTGLTFEMVKVLNENGYLVDIVDFNKDYLPTKKYDLYIGHGGKCKTILDNLDPTTKILQYVSGAYWKLFNQESGERYNAFKERKKVKEHMTIKRNMKDLILGEEYLTKKAHKLFTLNCPKMVESFGDYQKKFFFTGYGVYLDKCLHVPLNKKVFDNERNNFIYVGGTSGNIQKGMDLLLETFVRTPKLNLYIYCKVEKEILEYYREELKAKNVHYIYHWRFRPFHRRLKVLMKRTIFTIHAPINTGLGTAFMGSMGLGLIPVGYIDLIASKESCVISNSWDIDSLVNCVKEASNKSVEWCINASELTINNYRENWSVEKFREHFNNLILKIMEEK
jgi:hypothetical protein